MAHQKISKHEIMILKAQDLMAQCILGDGSDESKEENQTVWENEGLFDDSNVTCH